MSYEVFLEVANQYDPVHKQSVIRKLKEEDKDPDKPAKEQEYGLYTSDGSKLLGRHPSEEKAREQEEAIKAKGGSVIDDIVKKYSQNVDPTQMQVGESVYDETDTEYMVVENDPTTTNVVLMPKDQAQQPVPQGIKTVEDTELGAYTVQPSEGQTVAKKAQTDIDWDDIQSAAIDVVAYARKMDEKGLVGALDYLNFLILDQVEVPEDVDMSSMFARLGHKKADLDILAEFEKEVDMEVEDVEDIEELPAGESGYTDIMNDIKIMIAEDSPVVDIVLAIGEKYPRSMGEKVLADARSRGIL